MAMAAARRLWVGRSGPVHPLSPMVLTANDCDGWMETRDDEQNIVTMVLLSFLNITDSLAVFL